jgi:hypothetical protein
MNGLCHESRPAGSREVKHEGSGHRQHVVRSDTFKGGWAGVYEVDEHGNATLWSRRTRYEPLSVVRARVNDLLGVRKAAA